MICDIMEFSDLQFTKFILKVFYEKYPELGIDLISDIIDETLIAAPNLFFTREFVEDNLVLCSKCGFCCHELECDNFDNNICTDYLNRSKVCKDYPFYEIGFETGISLDVQCVYSVKLAEMVIDKRLEVYTDLDSFDI